MNNTSQIKIYYNGEIGDIGDISGMLKRANEELINRNNESFLFDYEIGLSNGFDGSTIVTIILSVSTPILLFLKPIIIKIIETNKISSFEGTINGKNIKVTNVTKDKIEELIELSMKPSDEE